MAVSGDAVAVLAAKFAVMRKVADERTWRVYLGSEAVALGHGGIKTVALAAGVSETTVAEGMRQIGSGEIDDLPAGRSRRPGGGRRKAGDTQPGLRDALKGLAGEATRGDPMAEITWCSLSLREIGRRMVTLGFRCGKDAIARMMREDGYSLQGMAKVLEGRQHPDRDAQFRHLNARIAEFGEAGEPAVSVDTKKKEQLGEYYRDGQTWRPKGNPVKVRDHDFPDDELGKITPYGVYDIAANRGFVSVGTSCDTGAFAVNALRLWWQEEGTARYPHATRLLVTADSGGSNGARCRLWKDQMQALAAQTGLRIEVCHFPPGTSKWNKIEHRMFCHITRTWSARPLMTADDAVAGIAATVTSQGLKCTAVRDDNIYPAGIEVSDARMRYLQDRIIERDPFHGDWNYAFLPAPRPAPEPEPAPERPGRVPRDVLNHPALTGMQPHDLESLAAALEIPFAARREQQYCTRRGGRRVNAVRNGGAPSRNRRLDVTGHVLAARLRSHLNLPTRAIGVLLGVDPATISHATVLTAGLLAAARIPLPATAPPPAVIPRTPAELLQYAAAAGSTLTIPENGQTMPEHFKPRQRQPQHART
jgi:Rhodopirellula transposase DDE domain